MSSPSSTSAIRWNRENVLDLVRKLRNDLIKDFLDERFLKEYAITHYKIKDISPVKIEFLKADLKELLISPIDVNHYQTLIDSITESDSASLAEGNETLFYKEIESRLKKYLF